MNRESPVSGFTIGGQVRPDGFTLVELLVSAGITVLLCGLMVAVVTNAGGLWMRASSRLACEASARHVFDLLSLDLSSALYHDNGHVWFTAEIAPKPWARFVGAGGSDDTSSGLADGGIGGGGIWLRFVTFKRGSNAGLETLSAPVVVSYRMARSAARPTNGASSYVLERMEMTPGPVGDASSAGLQMPNTLESGYSLGAIASSPGGEIPAANMDIGVAPGNGADDPAMIATDVVDFSVRCYVRDHTRTGGLRQIFPGRGPGPLMARRPAWSHGTTEDEHDKELFPEVVDITLRILTEEGARLIGAFETSASGGAKSGNASGSVPDWWQMVQANSHVFTRRVMLMSQMP